MKNLFLLFIAIISTASVSFATGDPVEKITILESKTVTVISSNESDASLFVETNYNESDETIEFNTEVEISFVQIFNPDGELEFQLPAMSKNVKIGMSFFEKGDYKLGFVIDGKENIQFTDVNIR